MLGFIYIQHLFFLKKKKTDGCLSLSCILRFSFSFSHHLCVACFECVWYPVYKCMYTCMQKPKVEEVGIFNHSSTFSLVSHPNVEVANMASPACQLTLGIIYLHLPRMELLIDHPAHLTWMWVSQDLNSSPQTFMASTWTTKPSTQFL